MATSKSKPAPAKPAPSRITITSTGLKTVAAPAPAPKQAPAPAPAPAPKQAPAPAPAPKQPPAPSGGGTRIVITPTGLQTVSVPAPRPAPVPTTSKPSPPRTLEEATKIPTSQQGYIGSSAIGVSLPPAIPKTMDEATRIPTDRGSDFGGGIIPEAYAEAGPSYEPEYPPGTTQYVEQAYVPEKYEPISFEPTPQPPPKKAPTQPTSQYAISPPDASGKVTILRSTGELAKVTPATAEKLAAAGGVASGKDYDIFQSVTTKVIGGKTGPYGGTYGDVFSLPQKPLVAPTRLQAGEPPKSKEQLREETQAFRAGTSPNISLFDISNARLQQDQIYGPGEVIGKKDKTTGIFTPLGGVEKEAVDIIRREQDIGRVANALQEQRFMAITGAKSGIEVLAREKELQDKGQQQIIEPQFTFGGYQSPSLVPYVEPRPRIGGVSTPEQLGAIEERIKSTPRASLQETLGFGVPVVTTETIYETKFVPKSQAQKEQVPSIIPQSDFLPSSLEPTKTGSLSSLQKLEQMGFGINPEFSKGVSQQFIAYDEPGKIAQPVPKTMESVEAREKLLSGGTLADRQLLTQFEGYPEAGLARSQVAVLTPQEASNRDVFGKTSISKPIVGFVEGSLFAPLGIAKGVERATGVKILPTGVSNFFTDTASAFTADIENEAIAGANVGKLASGQAQLDYNKTPQERVFGGTIENAFGSAFATPLISEPDQSGLVDAQLTSGQIVKVTPAKATELYNAGKLETTGGRGSAQFKATEEQIFQNELTSFLQRPGLTIGSSAEFIGSTIIGGKAISLTAKGVTKGIKALRGVPAATAATKAAEAAKPAESVFDETLTAPGGVTGGATSSITGKLLKGFGTITEKISNTKAKVTQYSALTGEKIGTAKEISTKVSSKEIKDLIKYNSQKGISINGKRAKDLIIESRKKKIPLVEALTKPSSKEIQAFAIENRVSLDEAKKTLEQTKLADRYADLGFKVESKITRKGIVGKIVPDDVAKQYETFQNELVKQNKKVLEASGRNVLSPEQTAESVAEAAKKAGGKGSKSAKELAEEFYQQQGKSEFIPTYLRKELSQGGEGEFNRVPGTYGSQEIVSESAIASRGTTNELLRIRNKELIGEPLTRAEVSALESAGREAAKKTATQQAGRVGGIIDEGTIMRFGRQEGEEGLGGFGKTKKGGPPPKTGGTGTVRKITEKQIENYAKVRGVSKESAKIILTKQAEREAGRTTGTIADIFSGQSDTSARTLMQIQRGVLEPDIGLDILRGGRQGVEDIGETFLTPSGRIRQATKETTSLLTQKGTLKEVPTDDLSRITNIGGKFKRVKAGGEESIDDFYKRIGNEASEDSLKSIFGKRGGLVFEELGQQAEKRGGKTGSQIFEDLGKAGTKTASEGDEFGPILKTVKPKGGIKPPSLLGKIGAGGASKIPLGLGEAGIFGRQGKSDPFGAIMPKVGQELSQIPGSITDIFTGTKQKEKGGLQGGQRFDYFYDTSQGQRGKQRLKTITPQEPKQPQDQYFNQIQYQQFKYPGEPGNPEKPGRGGPYFDFYGGGESSGESQSSSRKFFRVFDVAKTPFGRVEKGLGVQVQSSAPIFEIADVLGPRRRGGKKPIQETAFDIGFDNQQYF